MERMKALNNVREEFERALNRMLHLAEDLRPEEWNRRPAEQSWSVAECLDHITATNAVYLPRFAEAMEKARRSGKTPPLELKTGLLGSMIIRSMEPPPRMRMKTQSIFVPQSDLQPDFIREAFASQHAQFSDLVREAESVDIAVEKIPSAVWRWLKLSLYEWLLFLAAHERRHLWQAENALSRIRN